jgi:hypothetical protein
MSKGKDSFNASTSFLIGTMILDMFAWRVEEKVIKPFFHESYERSKSIEDFFKQWLQNKENTWKHATILKNSIEEMRLKEFKPDETPNEGTYLPSECFHILGGNESNFASGNSELHVLAEELDAKLFNVLLSWGFDILRKNDEGVTSKDIIESKGYEILSSGPNKGYIALKSNSLQGGTVESSSSQAVSDSPNEAIVYLSDGTIAEKILPIDMVIGNKYIFIIDGYQCKDKLTEMTNDYLIFECGYITTKFTEMLFYKSR